MHVVGISSLAGGHKTLLPQLVSALKVRGAGHVLVIVGGVVPPQDYAVLEKAGAAAIFGPGTRVPDAARRVIDLIHAALQ